MMKLESHPTQIFLFYLVEDPTEFLVAKIKRAIKVLKKSRSEWSLGPPLFIFESEDPPEANGSLGDKQEAVWTLGGFIELYNARPPHLVPLEVDKIQFEEVDSLIEAVRILSEAENVTFEFELDGELIGFIKNGILDSGLACTLLMEWKNVLDEKSRPRGNI